VTAVRKTLLFEGFDRPAEVSILLTEDDEMQVMNRQYRGFDKPTDVLSFSQLDASDATPPGCPVALGDVIISVPTAHRQADARGRSLQDEIDLLVVHGVLHLLGYDDETDEGAEEMNRRQEEILGQLNDGNER
jgi:probable rRNA maturation factor